MPKGPTIPCTKEEIDALLNYTQTKDPDAFTLFFLASRTGRRISEYLAIRVCDIDLANKKMRMIVQKRREEWQQETVLNDECVQLLRFYIGTRGLQGDMLLFDFLGKRSIQLTIQKYAKQAGIPHNVTFHNFRHYFITNLLRGGWHPNQVTKLTGHKTYSGIQPYDHVVSDDLREKAEAALENF